MKRFALIVFLLGFVLAFWALLTSTTEVGGWTLFKIRASSGLLLVSVGLFLFWRYNKKRYP